MPPNKGILKLWWGECFVSYGEPTEIDKEGCDGMYIENIHFKSKLHMILRWLIYKTNRD